MSTGIADQCVWRPEPHWLCVEECRTERCWLVILDPRRGVNEVGKADRVRLGEPVVRECLHLQVQLVGDVANDAVGCHPGVKPLLELLHPPSRPFRSHGLAQLIGLGRSETGNVDCHLHQLFLEERNSESLAERVFEQRMEIRHLLLAVATPDVRVHRTALDWAWPDERYLNHKVVEPARFETRQGCHLGTRLDLEYPDRVGAAQHCVHVVVLRDGRDVDLVAPVFTDQVNGVVQR